LDVRPTAQDTINFNLLFPSIFSKIFEKILEQRLSDFFENIFNPYSCAFRRGHGCQTTLLRLLDRIPLILICCFLFDK
jgi:hypothetical protein